MRCCPQRKAVSRHNHGSVGGHIPIIRHSPFSVHHSKFLLILVFALSTSVFGSQANIIESQLTTNTQDQYDAVIMWTDTIFTDTRYGTMDINKINDAGDFVDFVTGSGNQYSADADDISVVWADDADGNENIKADLMGMGTIAVTAYPGMDNAPAVSGGNVVFVSDRAGSWDEIFLYQVGNATDSVTQLSTGLGDKSNPDIDGNLAVWELWDGATRDVYAMTIGGTPFAVASDGVSDEHSPAVDGSRIAYIVDGDIAVYNNSGGTTTYLTTDGGARSNVKISGNYVYWNSTETGNMDIFVYDLTRSEVFQLTNDPNDQILTAVNGNKAVFHDSRNGNLDVWELTFTITDGPNTPPTANPQAVPDTGIEPLTVQFYANAEDVDGDLLSYFWYFGDAASPDNISTLENPQHTYSTEGTYTVMLQVADQLESVIEYLTITVLPDGVNYPPTIDPKATPDSGPAPLMVNFAANANDVNGDILQYYWDFGDYASPDNWAYVADPNHTYSTDGTYTVMLQVGDGLETVYQWITVSVTDEAPNTPPTASPVGEPNSGYVPLSVQFYANASDADGDPLTFKWDFDGDGTWDLTDENPFYTYDEVGTYTVTLEVSDGTDTATYTLTIEVAEAPNTPPTASPTAMPDNGYVPLTVNFAANADDADGDLLTYEWDFDGDSVVDSTYSDDTFTYDTAGIYTATVTVSDGTDTVQASVTVTVSEIPNTPPTASPTAMPDNGYVPLTVNFAVNADDADGDSLTYEWDFDGDGTVDSTLENDTFTYDAAGTYTATVTVSDGADTVQESVTVTASEIPPSYYVDANAVGLNNGSSWENAFVNLQDALDSAVDGERIWVAEGTYYPDLGTGHSLGSRSESFNLTSGVEIYGGFPTGGGNWFERNPALYETILSGDINTLDDNTDNSYHVVRATNVNSAAILDGFIITSGNANEGTSFDSWGGGLLNDTSDPTINNCTFVSNRSNINGGGMYNYDSSDPTVTNCTFRDNYAWNGGGMCSTASSNPAVINCVFASNSGTHGGGMNNYTGGNTAITNCTFAGNTATNGGAMYNRSVNLTATNCIFWGNTASVEGDQLYTYSGTSVIVSYSCIEGGWSGAGTDNISVTPFLADIPDQVRLLSMSPCIDAGDNSAVTEVSDILGRDRLVDGDCNSIDVVDMGAYEFDWVMAGDFAGGCDVDLADYAVFAQAWLTSDGDANYNDLCDISIPADKSITLTDLWIFVENWLSSIK